MGYIHSMAPVPAPRKADEGTSHVGYPYSQVPGPAHPDADAHHPHAPPSYEHAHGTPYPPHSHPHPHQHQQHIHGHHPTHPPPPPDLRVPPPPPPQSSGVGPHPLGHSHGHSQSRPHGHAHQHQQHPHPHPHQHQHQHVHTRPHIPPSGGHHSHPLAMPPHSRARLVAPPVHLGAFVHPFGPLPLPRNRTVARATLYIPALALPRVRPTHPRVWGSGPYTDDSDIISAAVHAGRVRWSEVREARRRGRDARVEVQVMPAAERYPGSVGSAPEPGPGGDPEDDGRGFFSAGWGNGHEGAGIDILDVTFVKGGTAHRAPGLGRQNRKQRLGEYAAERGAVLGFAASAAASGAVGGRTKRARGVGVGGPGGGPDSDETDGDELDTDSEEMEEEDEEDMDVDEIAARVTIVFEGGQSGALPGFKYEPDALREAVLHPRLLLPPAATTSDMSPRVRKRQRLDEEGREDAKDAEVDGADTISPPVPRGVELDTAVERFLLRMYDDARAKADGKTEANGASEDGAAEGEVKTSDEDQDQEQQQQQGGESDLRRWEIWLLGTLDSDDGKKEQRQLPPPGEGDLEGNVVRADGAALLQRGLRMSNLEFVEGEVRVLQGAPGTDSDSETTREGWAIEVRRWRWARS
ncbi:hypothetical protein BC826DRAFT_54611 [Russula brevipes]|nr:hypothetical protein BC826DRAFT_54611 [Russula brevipes]